MTDQEMVEYLHTRLGSVLMHGIERYVQGMLDDGDRAFDEIAGAAEEAIQVQDGDDIELYQTILALYANRVAEERLKAKALSYLNGLVAR
jgi:hypothetical protein